MINERFEELAALHAMDLLDEAGKRELREALRNNPELSDLVRDLDETAALLAHEAPQIAPPPHLKQAIMHQLPAPRAGSRSIRFREWMAYAIAACLMILGIAQTVRIRNLNSGLMADNAEVIRLEQSNAMKDLRLAVLEKASAAQTNVAYASARVVVAWDPTHQRGILSMQDLPPPPPGHDYQLWVLDPKATAPISAGLLTGSRSFAGSNPPSTTNPGFAISLEPSGGSLTPSGPILFAFAPGQ